MITETYILNVDKNSLLKHYAFLDNRFRQQAESIHVITKYLDLGIKTIRLQIACGNFIDKIEHFFSCSLKDNVDTYDKTIYIWRDNIKPFINEQYKSELVTVAYQNQRYIRIDLKNKIINAENPEENKYYFVAEDISYDALLKQGHLLVKLISQIVRTENSALVHSAAVGIDNKGVLICAKGGSGKSTLSVSCLVDGFQYVADDYLILNKKNNNLYALPIYSMITLSSQICKMIPNLKSNFMGNNYNDTKYVLNISPYDSNLAKSLPINAVVFPNIANIQEPTIEKTDKNRAITQLVFSTAIQMNNDNDSSYMKLLISLIKDLNFYQINLSKDLNKNVQILKQFIKEL